MNQIESYVIAITYFFYLSDFLESMHGPYHNRCVCISSHLQSRPHILEITWFKVMEKCVRGAFSRILKNSELGENVLRAVQILATPSLQHKQQTGKVSRRLGECAKSYTRFTDLGCHENAVTSICDKTLETHLSVCILLLFRVWITFFKFDI